MSNHVISSSKLKLPAFRNVNPFTPIGAPTSLHFHGTNRDLVHLISPTTLYTLGRTGLSRKSMASFSSAAAIEPLEEIPKLQFKPDGYNYWAWKGHKIHYVVEGEGPPILLIHGFGASAYHWRYNIPELAKTHKVYAMDLIGFGWSEKAIIDYDAMTWKNQVVDFLKEIVNAPAILVGNSLGGFTALASAVESPEQVKGLVLLNSAGQFSDGKNPESSNENLFLKPFKDFFQRIVLAFIFWQAKQPVRIKSVLQSVYINPSNVDDYLIKSISEPAADPNAGEVYYRMMTTFMSNQTKYPLDAALSKLKCPLLLLWGELDPWVGPTKAQRIKDFYPNTTLVKLRAGHCPHDEIPEEFNKALCDWLSSVDS